MKKYIFFPIMHALLLFSCNCLSNQKEEDSITVDSTILSNRSINWVTDESDIIIPNKRINNFKSDLYKMGIKGAVRKVEERHYKAYLEDGMMSVSSDLANVEIYDHGSPDCPENEADIFETNHDIYFDHDGFIIKDIYYNQLGGVKSIYYSKYDDNGNHLETNIQDEKGLRRSLASSFYNYSPDKYKPDPKNTMKLSSNGTITTYFTYDTMKNVISEVKRDNINGVFPFFVIKKFLYQYDEKENWYSRTYLLKDCLFNSILFTPMGVAKRVIYYW